jgi:hypothetical protein
MPARPVESRPGSTQYVHTRVPAEVKDACVTAARAAGLSVNAWAANVLRLAALGATGFPPPPPASHPLPDPGTVLAAYATGERLLGPCGEDRSRSSPGCRGAAAASGSADGHREAPTGHRRDRWAVHGLSTE